MKKGDALKVVIGLVASIGAGAIASRFIKYNVPVPTKKISKLMYILGAAALSGVASEAAEKYAIHTVDDVKDVFKTIFHIDSTPEIPVADIPVTPTI